jgi:transcriptional regulator with XRE-family HTH domain
MLETPVELAAALGKRIRACRNALGWTQVAAAERAGISYRTWRRLEAEGKASIDDLIRAAIALRCDQTLGELFPPPVATSMDSLLEQQRRAAQAIARNSRRRAVF